MDQNPYVYNPNLYATQTDSTLYESTLFYFVHKGLNWTAFVSGFLSCSMTIYLILFKTPEYFKQFSRVLLLCACSDMAYLWCVFWCQARLKITDGTLLFSMTGPSKLLSHYGQCMSIVVQTAAMLLSYIILPIQYHYRWSILKNDKLPVCLLLTFYIVLAVVFGFLSAYIAHQAYCTYDNPLKVDYAQFWYNEVPIPQLIVAPQAYFPATVQSSFFTGSMVVSYLVVLWFARLTYKQLKLNAERMSSKTLKLQRQFSRALFMQAIAPLLLVVGPILYSIVEIAAKVKTAHSGEVSILSTAFFPLLNSMSTLVFISPYRNQCIQMLFPCCRNKAIWPQSSTRPQNDSTQHPTQSIERRQIIQIENI